MAAKPETFFMHAGESSYDSRPKVGNIVAFAFGCLIVLTVIFLGVVASFKAFGRYQARQDAANRVRVSAIEIRNQAQRVKITRQQAQIRREQAVGIREAQDEISKTLTPLYVQFEMVDALKEIAKSGSNNSVVFIPSGNGGVPIINDVSKYLAQAANAK